MRRFGVGRTAAASETLPKLTVTRDPNCGCCGNWVEHMKAAGFPVDVVQVDDVMPLKARLGVPEALMSCHTAEIGGYVIEGHVPAEAVKRLLTDVPKATGIAVADMPVGSPGWRCLVRREPTISPFFPLAGRTCFARYRGLQQI